MAALAIGSASAMAQDDVAAEEMEIESEEARADSAAMAGLPRYEVDSLIAAWYSKKSNVVNDFVPDTLAQADPVIAGVPDDVFIDRLQSMMSPIPMVYNDQVRRFIELYVVRRRDLVQRMLGLKDYYFPIFESVLEQHGMPLELKYMSVIESALNPNALSRVGASGLWQFLLFTGKRYGL